MPKATITRKSGATVTIDGTPTEVHKLLQLHDEDRPVSRGTTSPKADTEMEPTEATPNRDAIPQIVNMIRSCDDAERIEKQILDKSNVANRCLLPLYIVHQHFNNAFGLTTGQISAVTKELGVPVFQSNVAHTFAHAAGKFVMGSRTRKKGVAVEYRINRRGLQHLENAIKGNGPGEASGDFVAVDSHRNLR
jgi:hypothetical protein